MTGTTKVCSQCKLELAIDQFRVRKNRSGGYYPSCRACERAKCNEYYSKNAQKVKAQVSEYARANKEKVQEASRDYYLRNSERIKEKSREWALSNKERSNSVKLDWARRNPQKRREASARWVANNYARHCANAYARVAARDRQTPPWADSLDMAHAYDLAADLTDYTGVRYEVDHIFPIRGKTVSGLHVSANLRVVPKSLNGSKSAKLPGILVDQLWVSSPDEVFYESTQCTSQ